MSFNRSIVKLQQATDGSNNMEKNGLYALLVASQMNIKS